MLLKVVELPSSGSVGCSFLLQGGCERGGKRDRSVRVGASELERRFGAHSPFPWPRPEVASASSRPKLEKKKNASLRRCIIFGLELWPCERRGTTTVGAPATTAPPDRPRATRAIGLRSRRALTHLAASCLKLLRLLSTSAVAQRSKLVPLVPPNGRSAREFQDPHSRGRRGGREERGVGGGVGGGKTTPFLRRYPAAGGSTRATSSCPSARSARAARDGRTSGLLSTQTAGYASITESWLWGRAVRGRSARGRWFSSCTGSRPRPGRWPSSGRGNTRG